MCPTIPLWFIFLAVSGAVFWTAIPGWLLLYWWINRETREITHIGQVRRNLFLPSIGRRLTGFVRTAGQSIKDRLSRVVGARRS